MRSFPVLDEDRVEGAACGPCGPEGERREFVPLLFFWARLNGQGGRSPPFRCGCAVGSGIGAGSPPWQDGGGQTENDPFEDAGVFIFQAEIRGQGDKGRHNSADSSFWEDCHGNFPRGTQSSLIFGAVPAESGSLKKYFTNYTDFADNHTNKDRGERGKI